MDLFELGIRKTGLFVFLVFRSFGVSDPVFGFSLKKNFRRILSTLLRLFVSKSGHTGKKGRRSKMERLVSETGRGILEKKEVVMQRLEKEDRRHDKQAQKTRTALQPTEALKVFFDRIPLFSVPGIDNAGGRSSITFESSSLMLAYP